MRLNMSISRIDMTPDKMIVAITAQIPKATNVVIIAFFLS